MSLGICGIGTAIPREMITQDDAARLAVELAGQGAGHTSAIQMLYRKTGVRKRHSTLITSSTNGHPARQSFFPIATAPDDLGPTTSDRMGRYEEAALDLAAEAARRALVESRTQPDEISHLITVSCTGFSAPGVDIGLVQKLGFSRSISRTHIGFMGCHGALNGLRIAAALGYSAPASKVLMCCVELCSLHHQYAADPQQTVANALFSDGAAAIVARTLGAEHRPWRLVDQFSFIVPDTADLMTWRIGDNGFKMRLSPRVPTTIQERLKPWLSEQLSRYAFRLEDIKGWAIHPGGPRILTACADALGLDYACLRPSQGVLAEFGNMSSPTILFILDQLRSQANCLPCVALAFGPGLTIEAALFI